jgi:hypothetical protein
MDGVALMEHGFFHPERGYWQTTNAPPQDILDSYPEGTVEVPLKPGADYDWDGSAWVYTPPPPPSPAELIDTYRRAVQAHVDATAQSKGYNDAAALAGYTSSTVPPWKAEAETFVAWRDQVWLAVFEMLAQIQSGDMEPPESPAALIGWLPQIEWP